MPLSVPTRLLAYASTVSAASLTPRYVRQALGLGSRLGSRYCSVIGTHRQATTSLLSSSVTESGCHGSSCERSWKGFEARRFFKTRSWTRLLQRGMSRCHISVTENQLATTVWLNGAPVYMPVSRADGRGNEDLRPLSIVYERLARVDGSARFGFGTFPCAPPRI